MAAAIEEAKAVEMSDDDKAMFHREFGIRIGKPLGQGKYGFVYLATFVDVEELIKKPVKDIELQPSTSSASSQISDWVGELRPINGQKVAVKWLNYSEEDQDKVKIETHILDKFRHPNIVNILTAMWLESDKLAIVMELSPIGDVKHWAENVGMFGRYPKLAPEQFRKFCSGIINGMKLMHENRFAHRDLHAGNVLVFPDRDDDRRGGVIGKLTDFGQAFELRFTDDEGKELTQLEQSRQQRLFTQGVQFDKRKVMELLKELIGHVVSRKGEGEKVYEEVIKELNYSVRHLLEQEKKTGVDETTV